MAKTPSFTPERGRECRNDPWLTLGTKVKRKCRWARVRSGARFSKVHGNILSIFVNVFFAACAVITDMVLGQCFHRIIQLL